MRGRVTHEEYGEGHGIAMTLLDGPLTGEQIVEQFQAFTRRFGFLGNLFQRQEEEEQSFEGWMNERLRKLTERGWTVFTDGRYALTEEGRAQAERAYREMARVSGKLQDLATPRNASVLTLVAHLFLAAVKLPAGIVSGSVGLLNDAIDTLFDGLSSLMVYWGIRSGHERLAERLLVLFMLGTGGYTLYEAIARIVLRATVRADWFAFAVVAASSVVCGVLWFVQRFIGLRRNSMALITQSVDSRNPCLNLLPVFFHINTQGSHKTKTCHNNFFSLAHGPPILSPL